MRYLLDTVTVVRHFTGQGKIGQRASQILDAIEESDDSLFVSVISLMEIMYLAEKKRIDKEYKRMFVSPGIYWRAGEPSAQT